MANLSSRNLTLWALRSHLKGFLACGVTTALMSLITGPSWKVAANQVPGGMAALASSAAPVFKELAFLTGPVDRLDTIGGYVSFKIFPTLAVILAIYAAIQGAQVLRGSEERGLFDLWFAAGRTRRAILVSRVGAFLAVVAGLVLLLFLGTGIGLVISQESNWIGALGQSIAVGLVAVFSFALGLFLSQFFNTARTASGIASGYLVASYFLANVYSSLGGFSVLRFLSPFFYYQQARTLVPGMGFDLVAMGMLLVGSAALTAFAAFLAQKRDVGGVALAEWRRVRAESYSFRPGKFWRRWLWTSWIAEQRVGLLFWSLGIFFFSALETAVVPQAIALLKQGGALHKFAKAGMTVNAESYMSFLFSFICIIVAGFAATQVARWVSDAAQHRNDAILIQPVSFGRFIAERWLQLVGASAVIVLAALLGTETGALIGAVSLDIAGLARVTGDLLLLALALGGVGMFAAVVFRSGLATAIVIAVIVLSFFLATISGLFNWPSWTNRPSVFDAFGSPYLSVPPIGGLIYLFALGMGGFVLAFVAMKRGARIAL